MIICPYCSEQILVAVEVWGHEWLPMLCCEALEQDFYATWEYASDAERHSMFEALSDGALSTRGILDAKLDYRLSDRVLRGPADWHLACDFVALHHAHHPPPQGWKWGVGCWNGPTLVGVAIVGHPQARHLDDGVTLEVTRLCTMRCGGFEHLAASKLYGRCARETRRLGYARIITYTLEREAGTSLIAAGWLPTAQSLR